MEAETVVNAHPDYREYEWAADMRSKLGRQVEVVVQYEPKRISFSGELLMFDEEGQVAVRDETFCTYWCWPNLETILL